MVTALPLPYCVYIAIVHRSSGYCCYQIKDFVDAVKRALNIFKRYQKPSCRDKVFLSMHQNQTGRKTMKCWSRKLSPKSQGRKSNQGLSLKPDYLFPLLLNCSCKFLYRSKLRITAESRGCFFRNSLLTQIS